jgi:hypothetical protein
MTAQATEIRKAAAQPVLMVTPLEGVETAAAALAEKLGLAVEVASTRTAALRLLTRRSYAAVILDQMLAEADPEGAELIWKGAGLAIPIPMSFALAGAERVEREVRSALARRRRETLVASAAAAAALDAEIKNAVTCLLLESQLALAEAPPQIAGRLQTLAGIAESLRRRLAAPAAGAATPAELRRSATDRVCAQDAAAPSTRLASPSRQRTAALQALPETSKKGRADRAPHSLPVTAS